jgi:hypothetical protein
METENPKKKQEDKKCKPEIFDALLELSDARQVRSKSLRFFFFVLLQRDQSSYRRSRPTINRLIIFETYVQETGARQSWNHFYFYKSFKKADIVQWTFTVKPKFLTQRKMKFLSLILIIAIVLCVTQSAPRPRFSNLFV